MYYPDEKRNVQENSKVTSPGRVIIHLNHVHSNLSGWNTDGSITIMAIKNSSSSPLEKISCRLMLNEDDF